MTLTVKDVGEIMALLADSRFDRLSLEIDGMKLRLARDGANLPTEPNRHPGLDPGSRFSLPSEESGTPGQARGDEVGTGADDPAIDQTGLVEIPAPLLGIFYRAPRPGEAPFVAVGDTVSEDTIVGIIEVMKLMTSARAGVRGTIVEIVAPNGELVESGAVLMRVRPEG